MRTWRSLNAYTYIDLMTSIKVKTNETQKLQTENVLMISNSASAPIWSQSTDKLNDFMLEIAYSLTLFYYMPLCLPTHTFKHIFIGSLYAYSTTNIEYYWQNYSKEFI